MEDILNSLYEAEKLLEVALEEYRSFVADKSNSLDERWQLFLNFEKYLPVSEWVVVPKTLENNGYFDNYFDTFQFEKFETINMSNLPDVAVERKLVGLDVESLKEDILATGYSSFVYDW